MAVDVKQYFLNTRPEMAQFLASPTTCSLEIGCGAGAFTESFLDRTIETWGIEPDTNAATIAAPKFKKLLVGTYDAVRESLPEKHFDLVVCNDVIEHMPDHDAFFRDISTKLKPGGYLVGSVPNIRHFTALVKILLYRDFPYSEDGILDRTHKRFFTLKSLRRSLNDSGFTVETLQGIRSIIPDGVVGLSPLQRRASAIAATALIIATLGYWADIQFPQIAFRVRTPIEADEGDTGIGVNHQVDGDALR